MAVGDDRPHPGVLLAPNWELVRRELGARRPTSDRRDRERDDVRALMVREVEAQTADLATYEQIRRVAILPRDLTIEDDELSPTLKVKRRVVEAALRGADRGGVRRGPACARATPDVR